MRKFMFLIVLVLLIFFSGCAELEKVRGVNFTMKNNGDERTFALGNGWKYTHTVTITNGQKGVVADVTARRGDSGFKKVAELREGEMYSETLESSMCYGDRRYHSSYWRKNPPVTTYLINRSEVVGEEKGKGLKEFIGSNQVVVELFSCDKARNQVTGIILGHDYSGGIRIIH